VANIIVNPPKPIPPRVHQPLKNKTNQVPKPLGVHNGVKPEIKRPALVVHTPKRQPLAKVPKMKAKGENLSVMLIKKEAGMKRYASLTFGIPTALYPSRNPIPRYHELSNETKA